MIGRVSDLWHHGDVPVGSSSKTSSSSISPPSWTPEPGKEFAVLMISAGVHTGQDLSAGIQEDGFFELMIRNAWHISGG